MLEDDMVKILSEFSGALVAGIVSSIIFILFWEWIRRPKLEFETLKRDPSVNQQGLGFYHIRVRNRGKAIAENCRFITVIKNVWLEPIVTIDPGKWDRNPEPVSYLWMRADPSLLRFIGEINIRPKSPETFCYLIKYNGEDDCFGFNADNYFSNNGLRHEDRRLHIGEYIMTIAVEGDNARGVAHFLLSNLGKSHQDISITRKKGSY